jgi:cellulose synthase/poly-beta-1,6-N-acetylglucosamine synthase-like glycosyltransferase
MRYANISAVICTRNPERVSGALPESAHDSDIVVAAIRGHHHYNASTDDTSGIAVSFCERNPNFRYVHEGKAGLSIARNTGIGISRADIVAFTDDDAEPHASWLQRILGAFRSSRRISALSAAM